MTDFENTKYGPKEMTNEQKRKQEMQLEDERIKQVVAKKLQDVIQNFEGQNVSIKHVKIQLLELLATPNPQTGWGGDNNVNPDNLKDEGNEQYLFKVPEILHELLRQGFISVPEKGIISVHIAKAKPVEEEKNIQA